MSTRTLQAIAIICAAVLAGIYMTHTPDTAGMEKAVECFVAFVVIVFLFGSFND